MTTEQKAKAYDEALKWMRDLYPNLGIAAKEKAESIFPELCESEDEKVRKALIEMVHDTTGDELWIDYNVHKEDALAWLKKQGKEDLPIQQAYEWGYTEGKRIERKHWIEKQEFSKDYNDIDPHFGKPINKVESKFKVGVWLCENEPNNYARFIQILEIVNVQGKERYRISRDIHNDEDIVELDFVEKYYHKFDIQDAKEGNVLCYKDEISLYKHDIKNCTKQETTFGGFVYHCCYDGKRFITDSLYSLTEQDKMDIHPATKEQRDLLFKKMKEAGYTFDFEKKELKKVEKKSQRMISAEAKEAMYDKPTDEDMKEALRTEYEKGRADAFAQMQKEWSEEDEQYLLVCKNALAKYQTTDKWDADIISCWLENKLKAPQNTWKPSDAQIRALEYIINNAHNTSYSCKIAKELLEQLRKLKGE